MIDSDECELFGNCDGIHTVYACDASTIDSKCQESERIELLHNDKREGKVLDEDFYVVN